MIHEKQFLLLETQAARKKKSNPPVSLLKQLFLKIIILHQKRRPVRSDPIRSDPIRSDPVFDPESKPGFVNGHEYWRTCCYTGEFVEQMGRKLSKKGGSKLFSKRNIKIIAIKIFASTFNNVSSLLTILTTRFWRISNRSMRVEPSTQLCNKQGMRG